MKIIRAFLFLLLAAVPVKSYPAPYENLYFSQISTSDGLTHNTVRSILVDRKGFLWAGTVDGLNRYDGYSIVRHKPRQGDPNSLHDHRIRELFEDRDGYIWIKSYAGEFSCYDPVRETYIDYLPDSTRKPPFLMFTETSGGDIWLWGNSGSGAEGCLRVRKGDGVLKARVFLNGRTHPDTLNCRFLYEDSSGIVWTGGDTGLYRIRPGSEPEPYFPRVYSFTDAVELDGTLYFTTEQSAVIEYNMRRDSFREFPCDSAAGRFLQVAVMTENELLISADRSGMVRYNIDNGRYDKPTWAGDPQFSGRTDFIVDGLGGVSGSTTSPATSGITTVRAGWPAASSLFRPKPWP